MATYKPITGLLADPESAGTFQPPELGEINFCSLSATQFVVFRLAIFLWYFVIVALTA